MLAAGQAVDKYWSSYPTVHLTKDTLELLESMHIGNLDTSTIPHQEADSTPVKDQWANEPKASNKLVLKWNQEKPFNTEPPCLYLRHSFILQTTCFMFATTCLFLQRLILMNINWKPTVGREGLSLNQSTCLWRSCRNFPVHCLGGYSVCQ